MLVRALSERPGRFPVGDPADLPLSRGSHGMGDRQPTTTPLGCRATDAIVIVRLRPNDRFRFRRRSRAIADRERDPVQRALSDAGRALAMMLAVAVDVDAADVVEHPAAAADQHQQAAAAVVVLGVRLEVLGEVADARR